MVFSLGLFIHLWWSCQSPRNKICLRLNNGVYSTHTHTPYSRHLQYGPYLEELKLNLKIQWRETTEGADNEDLHMYLSGRSFPGSDNPSRLLNVYRVGNVCQNLGSISILQKSAAIVRSQKMHVDLFGTKHVDCLNSVNALICYICDFRPSYREIVQCSFLELSL